MDTDNPFKAIIAGMLTGLLLVLVGIIASTFTKHEFRQLIYDSGCHITAIRNESGLTEKIICDRKTED